MRVLRANRRARGLERGLLARSPGGRPAIPAGPIGVAFGDGVHAGRMGLVRDRDEIFALWEREREFETWVAGMEAAYGHLPDGPSFDDERAGDVSRTLSLPYE